MNQKIPKPGSGPSEGLIHCDSPPQSGPGNLKWSFNFSNKKSKEALTFHQNKFNSVLIKSKRIKKNYCDNHIVHFYIIIKIEIKIGIKTKTVVSFSRFYFLDNFCQEIILEKSLNWGKSLS